MDRLYTDDPDMRARMLRMIAEGYDRLGLGTDAEAHARAALSLERKNGGLSADGLAASLNILGWIRHQQGDREEAKELLEEAVARRRTLGNRYRSELARSLNDLAVVLDAEGAYERITSGASSPRTTWPPSASPAATWRGRGASTSIFWSGRADSRVAATP